jgi:hypothetical protein
MNPRTIKGLPAMPLAVLLLLAASAAVQAQSGSGDGYDYSIYAGGTTISITNYSGPGGAVIIPTNINGLLVTGVGSGELPVFGSNVTSVTIPDSVIYLGNNVFSDCFSLTNVTIPDSLTFISLGMFFGCVSLTNVTIPGSVTIIYDEAFMQAISLRSVFFQGNAPAASWDVFSFDNTTAYYLPGTTGWSNFSANTGIPTVLWNPLIQASGSSFGISNNQFGFTITNGSTNNIPIVVEACTNLAGSAWTPLTNVILTNSFYFNDPQWTNYPGRFYRISSP